MWVDSTHTPRPVTFDLSPGRVKMSLHPYELVDYLLVYFWQNFFSVQKIVCDPIEPLFVILLSHNNLWTTEG